MKNRFFKKVMAWFAATLLMALMTATLSGCTYIRAFMGDFQNAADAQESEEQEEQGDDRVVFPEVPPDVGVTSICASGNGSYAVLADNSLWKWGTTFGTPLTLPHMIMEDVQSVTGGYDSAWIIKTDGTLWAWGSLSCYGLTDFTGQSQIKVMDDVQAVTVGGTFFLVLKTDGSLWGGGTNELGQLGNTRYDTVAGKIGRAHV